MSAYAQRTLLQHLNDPDSLEVLAAEGLNLVVLPDEDLRPIVEFALAYYYESGCTQAPSLTVLNASYGDLLDDHEITLDDPGDTIEWAIEDLKGAYTLLQTADYNRRFATAMAEADPMERTDVLAAYATELVGLSMGMESQAFRQDLRTAGETTLRDYHQRAANNADFSGLSLGMSEADHHVNGVHEGELAVLAAPPKMGKSMFLCWIALQDHRRGREVVLFTLENSVEMTTNRIACMAAGVDAAAWDRGECDDDEIARVAKWFEQLSAADSGLHIIQPDLGKRTFDQMVHEARLLGAESLLIDQLTFVEMNRGSRDNRPRHEKIGDALHRLKGMISTGRHRMSCVLAHQINREGVKAAEKLGYVEMYHLAESAEVERTADFVFALFATPDERQVSEAKLQQLAARRVHLLNWQIKWAPHVGNVRILHEIELHD